LKIVLIVEGKTEKAFLEALRRFLSCRPVQQIPSLAPHVENGRIPTGDKLKRVVMRYLDEGADAVIALTDVYTGTREFDNAADAKRKARRWVGAERRFHPHAAQHDFEAWLLPYWDKVKSLTGCSRNAPAGNPELVDHNSPPAYRIREAFRTGKKTKNRRAYTKPRDAQLILEGEDLSIAADKCQELKAFLNTLLTLCGGQPIG
jgi:hypothetical protein